MIYVVAICGWSLLVGLQAAAPVTAGSVYDRIALNVLYEMYQRNDVATRPVGPQNGPASASLQDHIAAYASEFESEWSRQRPQRLFAPYAGKPDALVDAIYGDPNRYYFSFMFNATQAMLERGAENGHDHTLKLFQGVLFETIRTHPALLLSIVGDYLFSSSSSFSGQALFYQAYVASLETAPTRLSPAGYSASPMFLPTNGPASRKLVQTVQDYLEASPAGWETLQPVELIGAYAGNPAKLLSDSILGRPNIHTWWFMWSASDNVIGPAATSRLFRDAALETIGAWPTTIAVFMDNLVSYFFGPAASTNFGWRKIKVGALQQPVWIDPGLPPRMKAEVGGGFRLVDLDRFPTTTAFYFAWGFFWMIMKAAVFLVLAATLLFLMRTPAAAVGLLVVGIVVYHGIVVAVFAEPQQRYVDHVLPLAIMVASMAVSAALRVPSPVRAASRDGALSAAMRRDA